MCNLHGALWCKLHTFTLNSGWTYSTLTRNRWNILSVNQEIHRRFTRFNFSCNHWQKNHHKCTEGYQYENKSKYNSYGRSIESKIFLWCFFLHHFGHRKRQILNNGHINEMHDKNKYMIHDNCKYIHDAYIFVQSEHNSFGRQKD